MGLLDSLFADSGSGGGLLDFLRNNAMNQQFGGGLQSDQAQYGAPMQAMAQTAPMQNAPPPQAAQPMQAPMSAGPVPAAPQPTQGQPPQQAPAFGPQGEGNFTTGMRALGNPGGLINKFADAVQGFSTGQNPAQRNQTQLFEAYKSAGLSPAQSYVAVLNPDLAKGMMGGGQTDDIKEYQFAKKEDPSLTFSKFMQQKKAVSGEYSLTPQYGTNEKGETVLMQTGKSGEAIQTKLPPGVKVSSGVEKIDAGTHWILYDKRTGTPVGTQPKDVAGKESAEKIGQAKGTAQAALNNGADLDAEATMKKIDEFVGSKGFNEVFGQLDQYRPSWTHSNEGTDSLARYKQLKGTAFLSAYSMLKGGGAITDIEGQKAGDAMARLDRAQGEGEAKAALKDFKEAVDMGLKKLRRSANGGAEPATPAASGGRSVDDLLKKYGN